MKIVGPTTTYFSFENGAQTINARVQFVLFVRTLARTTGRRLASGQRTAFTGQTFRLGTEAALVIIRWPANWSCGLKFRP